MKAYQLFGIGDLRYVDINNEKLPTDWALVRVKAAGICSSDIPRIYEKGTYNFPTIPGHEFSGIVVNVGDEKYKDYIGMRVGVFPLIPCKLCKQCQKKQYELCENYDYLGSRRDGGFADSVAVPIWNLLQLPEQITFEEAAMLEPVSVALHTIKRGDIKKGDKVAVVGTGMIGFTVAQWAKVFGASKVDVIGRNEDKKIFIDDIDGINYITQCNIKKHKEYDVVIEAVGSNASISLSIQIVKSGGKVVLMGNPTSNVLFTQNVYWEILRKQLLVIGTWNSSYDGSSESDWTEAIDAIINKKIVVKNLISHKYSKSKLLEGLQLMKTHKETYCKVITLWD